MTDQPIKLCKDCKHFLRFNCRPACIAGFPDYVDGELASMVDANDARRDPSLCGREAKAFVASDYE